MTDKILEFNGISYLDLPPSRLLTKAADSELESCIIIGHDKDGEFYFASSKADGGEVLWLIEVAKKKLLEQID